jgi:hypothetical protein
VLIIISVMPHSPTLVSDCTITGSLQFFEVYKYFRAPQIRT